ncbi:OLC1v1004772C1 [Oldenlandia corymbosa var. corymbosa]|uniref:OLC1v1004772C1 n=1 Tax=Oldenlandia corymbosa var. corymbosa TaxID=529605 RepID=A0AAV1DD13_OLDCO|nr:OLC1v1004772C1 [Oldenlandia corymbosa var. corymbosa]
MEFKIVLFCMFLFINIILSHAAMNKFTVKSIKSQDGDVIDCVDIYHQPAFDHPLLKDHTIKVAPSYHPEGSNNGKKQKVPQIWQLSGECPEGTIPIRRTENGAASMTKKKPIFSSSISTDADVQLRHEYAYTQTPTGKYFGTKAIINVWQPYVEGSREFSLSQLWIVAGWGSTLNTIEVGWHVFPQIYGGSNSTRLFIYWTNDGYRTTGCYNLGCAGFVQTNNQMAIGGAISQSEITLLVWKDQKQNVWWLQYNGVILGYWPTTIFTLLKDSASLVQWGGEIINSSPNGMHTGTDMGSGSFPQAGPGKASYFRNLQLVNDANTLISPPNNLGGIATNKACYNINVGVNSNWGNFFYYGGPGKNPNCP